MISRLILTLTLVSTTILTACSSLTPNSQSIGAQSQLTTRAEAPVIQLDKTEQPPSPYEVLQGSATDFSTKFAFAAPLAWSGIMVTGEVIGWALVSGATVLGVWTVSQGFENANSHTEAKEKAKRAKAKICNREYDEDAKVCRSLSTPSKRGICWEAIAYNLANCIQGNPARRSLYGGATR